MLALLTLTIVTLTIAGGACYLSGKYGVWVANVVYISLILCTLVTASKLVTIGSSLVISVALVFFSATFLITDYLSEIHGKKEAFRTVKAGLLAQLIALVLFNLVLWIPAADIWHGQNEMEEFLGASARIVCASLAALLVSQTLDVYLFNWIKSKTNGRHLWLRNCLSTFTAQGIDSIIYFTIAFAGIVPNLPSLIIIGWFVKCLVAVLDTPFLYLVCKRTWINFNKG